MNLNTTYKVLSPVLFFLFFITVHAQQKLIGFHGRGALDGNGTAYTINTNGTSYQKNVEFPLSTGKGVDMADGNDGFFYGSTTGNGYGDAGSVFKIKPDGTGYTILRKFTRANDGGSIRWSPVIAADGYLYGICEDGGQNNNGTIWKLAKDGSSFSLLKTFNLSTEATKGFYGSLVMGADGRLYGTIDGGNGYIIRINTNGSGFTKLVSFTNNSGSYKGSAPRAPMLLAGDGNFYGVCSGGGSGKGVAFMYNPATNVYTLLKSFTDNDGAYPSTTPVEAAGGYIIGGCPNYGTLNGGTIWKLKKDGSVFTVLQQLDLSVTGNRPGKRLYIHTDGFVYGTMGGYGPLNTGSFFKIAQDGTGFTVLRSNFSGGEQAWTLIYKELDNKFYIIFNYGGNASSGLLASVNPDGSDYKHIYVFGYESEGVAPVGIPRVAANVNSSQYGNAFGVTGSSGLYGDGNLFSYKTAFTNQRPSILHNFNPDADGYSPAGRSSPLLGSDGFIYGVLGYGGPVTGNSGTAYRINPDDTSSFTIIKTFGNYGSSPTGCTIPGVIMEAADGYLYGNTTQSGDNNRGTIFKMQKDGSNYSNIYQFGGSSTLLTGGSFIQDPVTLKLIGTGSLSNNDGVIFSISTDGTVLSIIKTFPAASGATDGLNPSGLLKLQNDTLYGTAGAGPSNFGLIYKIHKNGTGFSVIKSFINTEGGTPYGNLQISDDGYIYGTCGGTQASSSGPNIYKIKKDGTGFTILKSFGTDNNNIEGNAPGPVVLLPCRVPQNASEITFSNVSTSSITLSGFTPPASGGVTGYVVKVNTVNSFTAPADGSMPSANTIYAGSGEQVIYSGTSVIPITLTGLSPNTRYWFKVFAYGCTGQLYSSANTANNPDSQRTVPAGIVRPANLMARLDGVNDYANAGDVNAIEGNSAISFGGWVKPQSFPVTNFKLKSFVAKGDGISASGTSFQAGLYKNDASPLMVMAQISIGGVLATVQALIDSDMFRINQWSHFFVTWQSGGNVKLYVNGRMVVQSPVTYSGTVNNTAAALKLGSSDAGANEENFHGDIEEMQFYNVALTQCEIRRRKHITLTGTEPGLVAYYQFNEGDAIPVFNDYINNNNSAKQNGILALQSDLSAGGGGSECISVQATDYTYQLNANDLSNRLELRFPVLSPDGLMNASYVEDIPVGGNPSPGTNMLPGYWIVDNYGSNQAGLNATLTFRFADGILTDGDTANYHLYKRPSNGGGPWVVYPIAAVSLQPGNNTITINAIPNFSQLVLTSTVSVLPLQLISFQGLLFNTNAALQWQTANELNVGYFQLERKLPNENSFREVTSINAKNNGSGDYTYIDKYLPDGITWYRLRIIDRDGKASYSNIITIINKAKAISVFPNPAKDVLNVIYPVTNSKAIVTILSMDGRVVSGKINLLPNANHIDISGLAPGHYILKCVNTGGTTTFTNFAKR